MAKISKSNIVLTEEQQNLIADNIKLVYKFCSNKNIKDEDMIQNLIMGLCIAVPSFDKSRGEFSTFAFTVLHNEWIKQLASLEKESLPDNWIELRLDACAYEDETAEISDFIGFEDFEFSKLENSDRFKRALREYKYHYPFSWERDIQICYSLANNSIQGKEYRKVYNVSEQRARQILSEVSKFFIDFDRGKIHPLYIQEDVNDELFVGDNEDFKIDDDALPILLGWINNRVELSSRVTTIIINSCELAQLASKELGLPVGNSDMKKALYLSNFYPNSDDLISNPNWEYYIKKNSNLFKLLRRKK